MSKDYYDFAKRSLIFISIAAAFLLLWRIDNLLLLVFGAILIAVMLRALNAKLSSAIPTPRGKKAASSTPDSTKSPAPKLTKYSGCSIIRP